MFKRKNSETEEIDGSKSEALRLLMSNIPNYYGYRKKDVRSSSDKAFRKYLVEVLRSSSDKMSKINELLIHSQLLTVWGPAGIVTKKLEDLRKEVADTDYQKSTFFDMDNVEGENGLDLSIVYLLEIEILDVVSDLKEKIQAVYDSLSEMMLENVEEEMKFVMALTKNFEQKLNDRNDLIRAFEKMQL